MNRHIKGWFDAFAGCTRASTTSRPSGSMNCTAVTKTASLHSQLSAEPGQPQAIEVRVTGESRGHSYVALSARSSTNATLPQAGWTVRTDPRSPQAT